MRLDLKNLSTASEAFYWNNAEDHEIAKGMRSRVMWEEQHSEIYQEVIEIKAQADLHDLSELTSKLHVTTQQHTDLHTHIQVITRIIEAAVANQGLYTDRATKACPMKLPSFSGAYMPRRPGLQG